VVYLPFALNTWRDVRVLVRSRGAPQALAGLVREQVRELDGAQPVTDVRTLATLRAESLSSPRLITLLLGAFAGLALALTAAGLAGVVAFSVSQRLREIGIRLALGAEPASVLGLVLRQGMGMVLAGLGLGLAGALALSRLMGGLLFGVESTDPLTFGSVVLVLLLTAGVACVVPARRAAGVDPALALRSS
jgi:putative ABC transport system permease protein